MHGIVWHHTTPEIRKFRKTKSKLCTARKVGKRMTWLAAHRTVCLFCLVARVEAPSLHEFHTGLPSPHQHNRAPLVTQLSKSTCLRIFHRSQAWYLCFMHYTRPPKLFADCSIPIIAQTCTVHVCSASNFWRLLIYMLSTVLNHSMFV